jgi:hypothetical protein
LVFSFPVPPITPLLSFGHAIYMKNSYPMVR